MPRANLWEYQPGWTLPLVPFQPVGVGKDHLMLGWDPGSYGHFVDLASLTHYLADYRTRQEVRGFWTSSVLNWQREGLRLRTPSGHELFVPSRYSLGGR